MGCILFDIKLAQFSGSPVQNSFGSVETNCPEPEWVHTRHATWSNVIRLFQFKSTHEISNLNCHLANWYNGNSVSTSISTFAVLLGSELYFCSKFSFTRNLRWCPEKNGWPTRDEWGHINAAVPSDLTVPTWFETCCLVLTMNWRKWAGLADVWVDRIFINFDWTLKH